MLVCVGADLISVSFVKVLFCLMVATVLSYFRAVSPELCKSPGPLFTAISSSTKACAGRGLPTGFDDLFSHAGLKTHAAEWAVLVS